MKDKRPVNMDLRSLSYPPMAIASILHRISGLVLFILLPAMLCFLDASLHSAQGFDAFKNDLTHTWTKLLVWGFGSAWAYHVIAGIRHIILDMGIGESLTSARRSALIVIVLAVIAAIFLGIWIW